MRYFIGSIVFLLFSLNGVELQNSTYSFYTPQYPVVILRTLTEPSWSYVMEEPEGLITKEKVKNND